MSIEWTDEAVSKACKAAYGCGVMLGEAGMRVALDAAVKAQNIGACDLRTILGFDAGYEHGRAEAFEEAAQFIAKWASDEDEDEIRGLIEAIRNLAKEGK
jgi:hypothetical protein